jgi:hypothetical protein
LSIVPFHTQVQVTLQLTVFPIYCDFSRSALAGVGGGPKFFFFYRCVNPLSAILLPSTFRSPQQLPLASNFPVANACLLQFLSIHTSHIVRHLLSEHLTQTKHNSVTSQLVLMFILPRFKPRGSDLARYSCMMWENKNALISASPYVCPTLQGLTQHCGYIPKTITLFEGFPAFTRLSFWLTVGL